MLEDIENIDEAIEQIKKHTLSFSKFYSKVASVELSNFIFKDRETQLMMLDSIYENNSKLEQLLREIIEYDVNGETIRVYSEKEEE